MNKSIKDALDFDPLYEAGKISGKSYKEDESTSMLGLLLQMDHSEKKKKMLSENNDTHSGQTIEEWVGVVEGMGFKMLYCEDIPGTSDKWRIFWRDGILIFCDSYWCDKSINGGTAYFNYHGPRDAMHHCSSGFAGEINGVTVFEGSRDVREGLKFAIETMEEEGEFLSKWIKPSFLWLLHYMDTKTEGYDYKEITKERVKLLPDYVQDAISCKMDLWRLK